MRFLMKVSMPVETANKAAQDGFQVIPKILERIKPEAAYFVAEGGRRTALLFVNMDNSSDLPALAETLVPCFERFHRSNARDGAGRPCCGGAGN